MTHRFETKQWVPFPVEMVFAFFANPGNLPLMFPPELRAQVEWMRLTPPPRRPALQDAGGRRLSVAAGEGSEMLISFRPFAWAPGRMKWLARVVEFAWNSHFVDEQVRGPFAGFRHRHGVCAEVREGVEGTVVVDSIEYKLPLGPLGMVGKPLVQNGLEKSFRFRHVRLPEVLGEARRKN